MASKKDTAKENARRYAPLWVILFSTGATLLKSIGQHYAVDRRIRLTPKDIGIAFAGAALGYVTFRLRKGTHSDHWYTY